MSTWLAFASCARRSIRGSALVSELLYAILDGETKLIKKIKKEHLANDHYSNLMELIRQVEMAACTLQGRIDVRRLADNHAAIAGLPVDDLAIRRAYNNWQIQTGQSKTRVA